jgi:SAM-dependent methyltransferase
MIQRWKTWRDSTRHSQAERALARQLSYQQQKSQKLRGREQDVIQAMMRSAERVRNILERYQPLDSEARVAEVGSGAHGLIFYFGLKNGVGIDPLAFHYSNLFPSWQRRVSTIAAVGEHLPFPDRSFNVVLCDNVVDHAESPASIVAELARILDVGGLLYFTVNVHHPIYGLASHLHTAWNALGVHYEIGPFADHTTHLTVDGARQLFKNLPLRILNERSNIDEARAQAAKLPARHAGDKLKKIFFKNALYEVVAVRE